MTARAEQKNTHHSRYYGWPEEDAAYACGPDGAATCRRGVGACWVGTPTECALGEVVTSAHAAAVI